MDCIDKHAIKCGDPKCSVYIHKICFDLVAKVFVFDPKNWRCRGCADESKGRKASRSVSCSEPSSEQVTILKKEIDCLVREKELISSIASEREYIVDVQKKIIANLENKTVNICSCSKNTDSPGSLNVDIAKARLTKNGFLISCTNTADLKILKETLQSDTGSNFSICEPAKLNPRLIIYDVPKKCVSHKPQSNNPVLVDSFIETLISDNCLKATTADFKIVSVLNNKESFNIIIEISPFLFKPLVDKGYVFINWTRCRLQEHTLQTKLAMNHFNEGELSFENIASVVLQIEDFEEIDNEGIKEWIACLHEDKGYQIVDDDYLDNQPSGGCSKCTYPIF
nr:unnamed protein product [Callosobruchus analis]